MGLYPKYKEGPPISWHLKKKTRDLLSKEKGTVYKDWGGRITVCLIYPNSYFLGMSNLGYHAVYHITNSLDDVVCERAFLPDDASLLELERTNTPLFSLESQKPLAEFDVIAFSVSFEEDYLNILKILDLANIPFQSRERNARKPLLIAGGVAVSLNPEPIADFFDLFAIGEGEGFISEFLDIFKTACSGEGTKNELLKTLNQIEGAYVPTFYEVKYNGYFIKEFKRVTGSKGSVKMRKAYRLDAYSAPHSTILTPETAFKNTYLVEVERGCGKGCRFCAAGFLYLPPRERVVEGLKRGILERIEAGQKVGLVGAAVSEYSDIKPLCKAVIDYGGELTLSSVRLDVLDEEILQLLKKGGYKTITMAPEAGSERLRDVINKKISERDIMKSIVRVADAGIKKIKLYFMIGFPTETPEDIYAIVELVKNIKSVLNGGSIALSINPFIPKPTTPFQWCCYEDINSLKAKLGIIQKGLKGRKGVKFSCLSPRKGYIQALLSAGDRRTGRVLADAYRRGWREALKDANPDSCFNVGRCRDFSEILPWDFIDTGIRKGYLWDEYQRALQAKTTPPCDVERCVRCGVCR